MSHPGTATPPGTASTPLLSSCPQRDRLRTRSLGRDIPLRFQWGSQAGRADGPTLPGVWPATAMMDHLLGWRRGGRWGGSAGLTLLSFLLWGQGPAATYGSESAHPTTVASTTNALTTACVWKVRVGSGCGKEEAGWWWGGERERGGLPWPWRTLELDFLAWGGVGGGRALWGRRGD